MGGKHNVIMFLIINCFLSRTHPILIPPNLIFFPFILQFYPRPVIIWISLLPSHGPRVDLSITWLCHLIWHCLPSFLNTHIASSLLYSEYLHHLFNLHVICNRGSNINSTHRKLNIVFPKPALLSALAISEPHGLNVTDSLILFFLLYL